MTESFTPGALRALRRAALHARQHPARAASVEDLLLALIEDAESQSATLLRSHGLPADVALALLNAAAMPDHEQITAEEAIQLLLASQPVRLLLHNACHQARQESRANPAGTNHLLACVLSTDAEVVGQLAAAGLDTEGLRVSDRADPVAQAPPLTLDAEIGTLDLADAIPSLDLARILDASLNRAGEGLRVVEDYARFALDDPGLSRRLKELRHQFQNAAAALDLDRRLASRDTAGDVGTHITLPSEQVRENPSAVLAANFRRTCEALRSLEEYTKLHDVWLATRFESMRYDLYTLEKRMLSIVASCGQIGDARLCVLVGGCATIGELRWIVTEALEGGAQLIQLREKGRTDREVLARAELVRALTRPYRVPFILNDRADLARVAGADGVHLGQDDLSLADARRIVSGRSLLGQSTHSPEQIDEALLQAASYLGVGPVFSSQTKTFATFAGLDLVAYAAGATRLPWFAIGGIDAANLDDVIEAGASRVAVHGAVSHAERPRETARTLRERLNQIQ